MQATMLPQAFAISGYEDRSEAGMHRDPDSAVRAFAVLLPSVAGRQVTFSGYEAAKTFRL
jgi:hypothetical protein